MAQADQQTSSSFDAKWSQNPSLALAETLREGSDIQNWILGRNGFRSAADCAEYLSDRRRILDAGCGNGRVTALLRRLAPADSEIVGVDLVAHEVAARNLAGAARVRFEQADLTQDLGHLGRFDFIYCQEVLHHTSDPRLAFRRLADLLEPGGELAIYVYRRKAPLREHADDLIRERISTMGYEDSLKALEEITEFARLLSASDQTVTVPSVRLLGIEAGTYELQRFIYHFFFKNFWNPALSFHENNVINFDWYHPQHCTRHTMEEVEGWFGECGLAVLHAFSDPYGITMRGRRS